MTSEYIIKDGEYIPIGGKADIVDGKKIKVDCWYIVENGEWVEVDFTDGVFSRLISNKKGIKKVKTDNGDILFLVGDDKGNYAHGKTIAEAQNDLIYKAIADFNGDIPKAATGKEWVAIYRAVTGACASGVRVFVEEVGKSLEDTYTVEEISELTRNRYGAERFKEAALKAERGEK